MLTRIKIQSLFNVYDYDIDLTNADTTMVKFLTAPNGFGKTTILDFINAAMHQSYDKMFLVPFNQFSLFYDEAGSDTIYKYEVARVEEKSAAANTQMFYVARTCFYLTDERNLVQKKDNIRVEEETLVDVKTYSVEAIMAQMTESYSLDDFKTTKLYSGIKTWQTTEGVTALVA